METPGRHRTKSWSDREFTVIKTTIKLLNRSHRSESGAHFFCEDLRFFPRREVSAPFCFIKVSEGREGTTCPGLRSAEEIIFWERGYCHRNFYLVGLLCSSADQVFIAVLPVESRSRSRGICQPIQRKIVKDFFRGGCLFCILTVSPLAKATMYKHPACQPGRRVGQSVTHCLRTRVHKCQGRSNRHASGSS
jgi:hypothetical protein